MKSKLMTMLFVFISLLSSAQAYLGMSSKEVHSAFDDDEYSYATGYTDAGEFYIYGSDSLLQSSRMCYFGADDKCYSYVLILEIASYREIASKLDMGYVRVGGCWSDDFTEVKVSHSDELNCYLVRYSKKSVDE